MSRVTGIVLAAGLSRRLGRPKQLLMLDEKPLIAHVVERALASNLDEVIVVTGAHRNAVEGALAGRSVRLVHNPRYAEGQGISLAAGIAALGAGVGAAVILLADQPDVTTTTIDKVVGAFRENKPAVVMAKYGGQQGHPVLFSRERFPELLALSGDTGGREIVRAHQDDLVLIDGGASAPPSDVDTEEAWEAMQRAWAKAR